MKTFETEWSKDKIWLDSGLMVTLEDYQTSAVAYKKGFFSKWKIVNEQTSDEDLNYVLAKIQSSSGSLGKSMMKESYGKPMETSRYRFDAKAIVSSFLYPR